MSRNIEKKVYRYLAQQNLQSKSKISEEDIIKFISENQPEGQKRMILVRKIVKRVLKKHNIGKGKKSENHLSSDYDKNELNSSDQKIESKTIENGIDDRNILNESVRTGYSTELAVSNKTETETPSENSNERPNKRKKTLAKPMQEFQKSSFERPTARYSDLAGISSVLNEVRELIEYPLLYPKLYSHIGIEPPRGVLLHGPPGCGKTLLAKAIAGELGIAFIKISAPEIVSGMSGESEQKVRELFSNAITAAPCIIFIDEIDSIASKRENSTRGMEKRIVAQILTCMDDISLSNTNGKSVMLIGATNRPNDLDSALRRAGRFDREICLGIPDKTARQKILEVLTKKIKLDGSFDFALISSKTPGYVGADLSLLTKQAGLAAINRFFKIESDGKIEDLKLLERKQIGIYSDGDLSCLSVNMDDFTVALTKVQPSSKREGFATVPDVSWNDIGALVSVREELALSLLEPIRNPERFQQLGLRMPAGVLLYGPPGCGKTLLAKAISNESGANFISVKGPELLDKYVGESERAVRQVFQRARASSPCIVFFDELDALCPKRGSGGEGGVSERMVNQLLTEMDGLEGRRNVYIVAATNRPDLIDPAMLRPGRLDKLLFVPLPTPEERVSILTTLSKASKLADDIDLESIAKDPKAEGYSGADLSALLREAGLDVIRSIRTREADEAAKVDESLLCIGNENFEAAFSKVVRSVSDSEKDHYLRVKTKLGR